jgi:uridine kinase
VRSLGSSAVSVISHDAYYHDRSDLSLSEREHLNYDHPDALETDLLVRHVEELGRGHAVDIPVYDFTTHTRRQETHRIESRAVLIVDGILILADRALRELMDIRVFVDTDADLRLIRRIRRDTEERGRTLESVTRQYMATARIMHLEFVEPSKRYAHIIIPEGGMNEVAVDMLVTKIRAVCAGSTERIS